MNDASCLFELNIDSAFVLLKVYMTDIFLFVS